MFSITHSPCAELAVDAPVDEHAELGVAEPRARGGALGREESSTLTATRVATATSDESDERFVSGAWSIGEV